MIFFGDLYRHLIGKAHSRIPWIGFVHALTHAVKFRRACQTAIEKFA